MNDLIGHNQPPTLIESAVALTKELSGWMGEVPVIQTEDKAREAKLWADRAHLCLGDMEDERKAKVAPLRAQVKEIDDTYRTPKEVLGDVLRQLKGRLETFRKVEEERRLEAARIAALAAEEAERKLVEARLAQQAAIEEAAAGVLGGSAEVDVVGAVRARQQFDRAERAALRADREAANVKIGGGLRSALSARTYTVIHIDDPIKVLQEIGLTPGIEIAMRRAISNYKRINNKYPDGVSVTKEKEIR